MAQGQPPRIRPGQTPPRQSRTSLAVVPQPRRPLDQQRQRESAEKPQAPSEGLRLLAHPGHPHPLLPPALLPHQRPKPRHPPDRRHPHRTRPQPLAPTHDHSLITTHPVNGHDARLLARTKDFVTEGIHPGENRGEDFVVIAIESSSHPSKKAFELGDDRVLVLVIGLNKPLESLRQGPGPVSRYIIEL